MKLILPPLLYCLFSATSVFAIDSLTLQLGSITGNGWQAEGVVAKLDGFRSHIGTVRLDIAVLILPELKKPLKKLSLKCQHVKFNAKQVVCSHAQLYTGSDFLDNPTIKLSFTYNLNSQHLDFRVDKLALGGGFVTMAAKYAPKGWQASLNMKELELEKLLTQLGTLIDLPSDLILAGNTTLTIKLSGDSQLRSVSIYGQATDLRFFTDVEQTQGGENIALKIVLKANRKKIFRKLLPKKSPTSREKKPQKSSEFQVLGTLTVNRGDVCIEPLCIEIKDEAVTTTIDLIWQPQHVKVHHFDYTHTNVMTIQGSGDFTLSEQWDINTLSVRLIRTSLKQLYTHYLQGLLDEDSKFNDLETGGQIKIKLDWNKNNQQVIAQLDNVNVEDQKKRFGLQGIRGKIQWHSKAQNLPSHLRWSSAYLASNKIKLGASQWRANFSGDSIRLLAPWYQPILDGAIRIEQFRLENIGKHKTWQLSGKLYPISLQTLSNALDGPRLSGQISVDMPLVKYRNNRVDIEGELRMRIFDGDIIVHS
jgi:hypothetical protein